MSQIDLTKSKSIQKGDALFENLVSFDELLGLLKRWLRREIKRSTVYSWVSKQGMPHEKIRGELYFPPHEVAIWLKRT